MKRIKYIILSIIALTIISCDKDDFGGKESLTSFSQVSVGIADLATTRTYIGDNNAMLWSGDESIGIFSDVQGVEQFNIIKDKSDQNNAAFSGNTVEGNKFYAFYPYAQDVLDKDNKNLLHLNVSGAWVDNGKSSMPMVASGTTSSFLFKQVMGLIKITLTGDSHINAITIKGNKNELIAGAGTIDLSKDTPLFVLDNSSREVSTSISCGDIQLVKDKPTMVYFPMPVMTLEEGFTLTIEGKRADNGKDYKIEKNTHEAVAISRAMIKSFSGVDTDAILKAEDDEMILERQALIDLYNSTNGANWTHNDNWGSGEALSKWYGVITDEQGRVTHITLSQNNLRGHIPESIGDLTNLIYLNLCFNQLSGEIPESIGNLTKLAYLLLGSNELTGSVPKTIANIAKLESLDVSQNKMNGTIPAEITNASWWDMLKIAKGQQDGYFLRYESIYESTDYSQDGKIITLQSHTVGNGVPLVILGDAFSDRMIANNTFINLANEVMEAFFELEPFITFRDYFDVYAVVAVSLNEITGEDTAYKIDNANNIPTEGVDRIKSDVLRIPSLNGSLDNVTCAIFYKEAAQSGSWYSYIDAGINHFNFGECSVGYNGHINKYLVHHEVGGHCFGGLADERVNDYAPNVYPESDYEILDLWHSEGYDYNIDYHNTKETSFWKDFFANPEYEVEKLDLYEGALYTYGKGIYRPSFSSIMEIYDENYYYYNAPSRLAIYKRIMELSGEGYSFEKFLEYDKKNLEAIKNGAITRNYVERYNNDISIESPCVISFK